jgi:hypothetical protein
MTTLAKNKPRSYEAGTVQKSQDPFLVIANDDIFEGAAVGLVDASGHARPLTAVDRFVGFASAKVVNTGGLAAAQSVSVYERGVVQLTISGVVITDVGQPVYASDDDTFSLNPADGAFVGTVKRYVTTDTAMVEFNAPTFRDPWANYPIRETIAGTKTYDAEDTGKLFCLTDAADGDTQTIPAVATGLADIVLLAVGPYGSTAVVVDGDNSDGFIGPDITAADGKSLTLTKATQRRGDFLHILGAEADGHLVKKRGTWVRET